MNELINTLFRLFLFGIQNEIRYTINQLLLCFFFFLTCHLDAVFTYTQAFILGFVIGLPLIKQTTSKEQEKKTNLCYVVYVIETLTLCLLVLSLAFSLPQFLSYFVHKEHKKGK